LHNKTAYSLPFFHTLILITSMKKAYLLAALALSVCTSNLAQAANNEPDDTATIERRAVVLTRTMASKIHLDEGQYLKLKQLNIRMLTEMESRQQEGNTVVSALDEHTAAMQAQYQSDMLALLYPAQQQLYRQLENSRMAFQGTRP